MKRSVFISHSSEDKIVAEQLCAYLEANNVLCWIAPRDVTPGKNYGAAILDAIDECRVFVLILSANSNKSNQVVREVERAASNDSIILPFRIENVQPSRNIEFYVSAAHWLDASEEPVQSHFAKLLTAIRNWQRGGDAPVRTPAPAVETSSGPAPSRFPVITVVIVAIVGAAMLWIGLLYKISHRAHAYNLAARPSVSVDHEPSLKPTPSVTPEPSQNTTSPVNAPSEAASTERTGASPMFSQPRRRPGDALRAPVASPAASITPAPSRLRPGQHLTSPTPVAAVSPTAAALSIPIVREVGASSHLDDDHRPILAFDGKAETAWVPKGRALNQLLTAHFKVPVLIHSVSILNGDGRDEEHYRLSNRARTLRITLSDGATQIVAFEDVLKTQRFELAHPATVDWIKFEILSLFRGSDNNHAAISEISFNQPPL